MPNRRARWVSLLLLLLGGAVAGILLWIYGPPLVADPEATMASERFEPSIRIPSSEEHDARPAVAVETVIRSDLSLHAEATGHLLAWRLARLSSDSGGQVVDRRVEEGDWIEAGGVLLELDPRQARLELEEARAELLKAQARFAVEYGLDSGILPRSEVPLQIEAARKDFEEKSRLFAEGLVSRDELDRSQQRLDALSLLTGEQRQQVQAATSGLVQAEQRVKRAQDALERTRLEAPFAGRVADLEVEVGQRIGAGEVCLTLQDDSRLKVNVEVLEEDVVRLEEGAPVSVRIPSLDDLELVGAIHSINPRIDHETGTGRVTVALPNQSGRLLPGLFAYVHLEARRLEDRVLAPREAILDRDGREVVFRIVDDKARWTYVTTGVHDGDRVEILSGLDPGDVVAVDGHYTLSHDSPVRVLRDRKG